MNCYSSTEEGSLLVLYIYQQKFLHDRQFNTGREKKRFLSLYKCPFYMYIEATCTFLWAHAARVG